MPLLIIVFAGLGVAGIAGLAIGLYEKGRRDQLKENAFELEKLKERVDKLDRSPRHSRPANGHIPLEDDDFEMEGRSAS
jgi:hypothetical protein